MIPDLPKSCANTQAKKSPTCIFLFGSHSLLTAFGNRALCGPMFTALDAPPPTKYNFLSLGAGVQSSTLALMAAHGEIGPMPDAAIFADTQAEPASVYKWLDWLEKQLPFPVVRVTAGNLEKRELTLRVSKKSGKTYRKTAIPAFAKGKDGKIGIISRKCTTDHKIIPITQAVRKLANIKRGQKECTVTQWIGISWDEIQRMKDMREPWNQARWPLIEKKLRREDCITWMKNQGYPTPPRSACSFCPFHNDSEWRRLRDFEPDAWHHAIKFEKQMQEAALKDQAMTTVPYLHPSCVPLEQVDLRTDEEMGQMLLWNTIQNECAGMCGV
jgi:hypothetical protein